MYAKSLFLSLACCWLGWAAEGPLAGTRALTATNDLGAGMVSGISRYLDRATTEAAAQRGRFWQSESADANAPITTERFAKQRARLAELIGLRDTRDPANWRIIGWPGARGTNLNSEIARGVGYRVFAVEWDVFRGVKGEGLLLVPDAPPRAQVIVIPDADQTPEQFVGLAPGLSSSEQLARICAEQGCRVLVPSLIDRGDRFAGNPGVRPMKYSQRETLWRAGYEMGRTPIAYELQRVLAAADWLEASSPATTGESRPQLGVLGYGEGGLLAFYAAALDPRFAAAYVSGYFAPREALYQEPIDRNVFGLLPEFGDAEIAALVQPRWLWIETGRYPVVSRGDEGGGAPGRLAPPDPAAVDREFARVQSISGQAPAGRSRDGGLGERLEAFLGGLRAGAAQGVVRSGPAPVVTGVLPDAEQRTLRLYRQLLEDTQALMRESEYTRREFWKRADFKGASGFEKSSEWYRDYFRSNIVGVIPSASVPIDPQTRFLGETRGVKRYEVVLEVHPDVDAYGILCLPPDLKPGERRPVVVCQHGLEGRPTDVSDPAVESPYYHQFGFRLAELGFVTFAPQNPYLGNTRFRQVLRQAQPLGLTLWSFIVRQHEVITDWLARQEFVDPERIAFYGLSYGGKTAMRVPVLVPRYCLSICSADYNEWIWKNTSARSSYSYLFNNEYDMPEWNLGNTFNYAEMSWLISPRPFMVERGHDDGVAPDEWVAYEYAKTRRHYVKMGWADRTQIEFFDGPHSIHGVGTFAFLREQLRWPAPK